VQGHSVTQTAALCASAATPPLHTRMMNMLLTRTFYQSTTMLARSLALTGGGRGAVRTLASARTSSTDTGPQSSIAALVRNDHDKVLAAALRLQLHGTVRACRWSRVIARARRFASYTSVLRPQQRRMRSSTWWVQSQVQSCMRDTVSDTRSDHPPACVLALLTGLHHDPRAVHALQQGEQLVVSALPGALW
jgi:hypothetical protein